MLAPRGGYRSTGACVPHEPPGPQPEHQPEPPAHPESLPGTSGATMAAARTGDGHHQVQRTQRNRPTTSWIQNHSTTRKATTPSATCHQRLRSAPMNRPLVDR